MKRIEIKEGDVYTVADNLSHRRVVETSGSTPVHPDDQLELLGKAYELMDLLSRGVSFIQFARCPYRYGFCGWLRPFRKVHTPREKKCSS